MQVKVLFGVLNPKLDCLSFRFINHSLVLSSCGTQLVIPIIATQDHSQIFFGGGYGFWEGGSFPETTVSIAYMLPGNDFGRGSNPQTPPLGTAL